jgi:Fungal specific transcription factor domain
VATVFIEKLQKEKFLLPFPQSEVLEHLLASPLHQLQDRAWLVMFYTITLSTNDLDEPTKMKLRSNLWLTFNDVRLLLEPTISRVQALVILVCYGEKFMTPSVCWMLISKACIMLQAVGITHARFDSDMRERRNMLFWRLNALDKALALILCKPPTISREMAAGNPIPSLDQLLTSVPGYSSTHVPLLFDAHYMNQMHLLSNVMADAWHCIYGQDSCKVLEVKESLEKWYREAIEVVEMTLLSVYIID